MRREHAENGESCRLTQGDQRQPKMRELSNQKASGDESLQSFERKRDQKAVDKSELKWSQEDQARPTSSVRLYQFPDAFAAVVLIERVVRIATIVQRGKLPVSLVVD